MTVKGCPKSVASVSKSCCVPKPGATIGSRLWTRADRRAVFAVDAVGSVGSVLDEGVVVVVVVVVLVVVVVVVDGGAKTGAGDDDMTDCNAIQRHKKIKTWW